MITEIVKFKPSETVSDEQFNSAAEKLVDFQTGLDGFIDAELIKDLKENEWYFIFHYENMEKFKLIGEKLRSEKMLDEFILNIVPGSLSLSFNQSIKKW